MILVHLAGYYKDVTNQAGSVYYHNVDGTGGFAIHESSDAGALGDYALDWNGMIEIVITPLMDDETITNVLGAKFS